MRMPRKPSRFTFVLILLLPLLACNLFEPAEFQNNPTQDLNLPYKGGKVVGSLDTTYFVTVKGAEKKVICTDSAAEFQMIYSLAEPPDSSIPMDPGYSFFRLNVYAASYPLNNDGACDLSGSRSDQVVHYVMDGEYRPDNEYLLESCGKSMNLASGLTTVTESSKSLLKAEIVCKLSDQIFLTFKFADMQLK